jgi:hypothetical protein
MQSDLRLLNPAWLANQLAVWTLGGALDPLQLLPFIVPIVLGGIICRLEWRRSL